MQGSSRITYDVDIVFCIDATESMDNIIDIVKANAIYFYEDVTDVMKSKGKTISQLRLKVIIFRDYAADGDNAMLATGFFNLPYDAEAFRACIESIRPYGGGDDPEDGLEALAFAMDSDWSRSGFKRRHVIAVWSDAPTHELGYARAYPEYPRNMVSDFRELSDWWMDPSFMDQSAKRLLLFTPDEPYWSVISDNWDNVIHIPSQAGSGLREVTYRQIINSISNTI